MWVAMWIVCIATQGCEEVVDVTPKYFQTEQECNKYGEQKAIFMSKFLTDKEVPNKIGYRCERNSSIREANGT